jgi:hypothetical protein
MGVRVRVRIRYGDREATTAALVNTGYEGFKPEIHIPLALAKRLGLSLENAKSERYAVVSSETTVFRLGKVLVSLDVEHSLRVVEVETVMCLRGVRGYNE